MTLARLMIAFVGTELPPSAARRIHEHGVAGVTLFRVHNIVDPPQIRRLTAAIQKARPAGAPPLLVAADQEGGQLVGLGEGTTQFAGAMALGASGDEGLAERVAGATAREMRALGVNVNYAPVCDVANNPAMFVPAEAMERADVILDPEGATAAYQAGWTKVRAE